MKRLPKRSEVDPANTWDLASLFAGDEAWDAAFAAWQKQIDGYAAFVGKLADSPQTLAACLQFDLDVDRAGDRLGTYASLKTCEDQGNGVYQRMQGRYVQAASLAGQASSFIRPEILAIPAEKMEQFLQDPAIAPYKLLLTRIIRFKPHTLSDKEEKLLAMQTEMAGSSSRIFRQLNDTDMKFGTVKNGKGEQIELSHATYTALLYCPDGQVRREAFAAYYRQYTAHEHTLAETLNSSMQRDVYYAKARNFGSSLEAALFPDQAPIAVYDNLIASIHGQLPALHEYYDVRRRKMGLSELHFYDTYVPIVADLRMHHAWDEAVEVILAALAPLGSDYCDTIRKGFTRERWCDRYENRGKQSGAFSAGSFDGKPYILINYQEDTLDSVFTLAHEGGHSMHSHYSCADAALRLPRLLPLRRRGGQHLQRDHAEPISAPPREGRSPARGLINRQIDAMRATIFRQTMFAEFEKLAHASAEAGEPLTLDRIREIYHGLLKLYHGPGMTLDADLDVECLRIPHFYRDFYVYKYATGMSAAMALVDRVSNGGKQELNDYLNFLKGGCSKDPLDLLREAGVDMEKPDRVDHALSQFGQLVKELDRLI